MIERFVNRLRKIGIEVELVGNIPWIYLDSVAGRPVRERFRARHGFTAFFLRVRDGEIVWSDRRRVFVKIREML